MTHFCFFKLISVHRTSMSFGRICSVHFFEGIFSFTNNIRPPPPPPPQGLYIFFGVQHNHYNKIGRQERTHQSLSVSDIKNMSKCFATKSIIPSNLLGKELIFKWPNMTFLVFWIPKFHII